MHVINNRPSVITLPPIPGPGGTGARRLVPGANLVPDDEWQMYLGHPGVETLVAHSILTTTASTEEIATRTHIPGEDGLASMTIPNARPFVDAATDPELLMAWRDADKRAGIRDLIDARLEALASSEPSE